MFKLDALKQRITPAATADDDMPITIPVTSTQDITASSPDSAQDYFSSAVQSMSDSLVVIGKDGRIAAVNQATLQLLGYEEQELIGQLPDMLFADGTIRGNGLETLHERGIVQRGEKTLRTKDGRGIPVFYSGSVLRNHDGQVSGVVCVAHDATKQKKLEQGLRDALNKEQELGQLKSQFVATVSHEFRTPLAIIQTNNELIRLYQHRMDEKEKEASFEMVQKQIKHMTRLLEGALTIEKMQSGKIDFHPEALDMDQMCQEMVHAIQGQVKRNFTYTYQGNRPDILADKHLINQILTNLMSNAVKFSDPDSQITVTLSGAADHLSLEIRDEGVGIPQADQQRLFEPFFRASNVSTIGGTGLGLAVTKQAVDLHGGTINIHSQADSGTTVTVTLPYAPPPDHKSNRTANSF